jgi:uncharacterized membrane protein HdeD (DUF308 family)
MLEQMIRNWWVLALRGVVAILFGVIAFSQPGITLTALVWTWGAYALVDGVCALVSAVRAATSYQRWGMLLLEGVAGIAAGIVAFGWTGITALTLLYLIAAWAIVTGIFEIAAAIRLREMIEGEWLLGLAGVLSILLGVLIVARPGAGLLASVWIIGSYALIFGIVMLVLAFRLRALSGAGSPRRTAM